jgi:hypothetical protein
MHSLQVQDGSPGQRAGLEAFFDFIVAIGNTRLVSYTFPELYQHKLQYRLQINWEIKKKTI